MPFVAYVHEPEGDPSPGQPPWEPDWRVWRPLGLAALAAFAAGNTSGAATVLLIFLAFGLVCRAITAALPDWNGMREYRQ